MVETIFQKREEGPGNFKDSVGLDWYIQKEELPYGMVGLSLCGWIEEGWVKSDSEGAGIWV